MKRSLLFLLSLAGCTGQHMVGQGTNRDAITCAAVLCGGATVCVDDACVEPSGSCGGFAGLTCPTGQRCVDNPRDNCDPNSGGADCSGVCVPAAPSHPPADAGHDPVDAGSAPMSCGGHVANPQMCPSGFKCVDDPNSCSMAVDCTGICVPDDTIIKQCGGFTPNPPTCEAGFTCFDNPINCCMANDAPGICVKNTFCGGIAGIQCPNGYDCVDDPNDSCDPNQGGADCGGLCAPHRGSGMCGGFAGIQCPSGLRCLDDPGDGCDPNNGGADCSGLCVP
jgi:hypothetical protein